MANQYRIIPKNEWTIQVKSGEHYKDFAIITNINEIENLDISRDEKVQLKSMLAERKEFFNSVFNRDYLVR